MTAKTTMEDALNKLKSFITSLEGKGDLGKRKLEPFEIEIFFGHVDDGSLILDHEEANEYRKCLNKLYYSKEIYKQHSKKSVEL